MKNNMFTDVASITRSVATRSALNPTLMLTALCTPIGLAMTTLANQWGNPILTFLWAAPPTAAILQICWFTVFDRNRLESDQRNETRLYYDLLANKIEGKDGSVTIEASQMTNNPQIEEQKDV